MITSKPFGNLLPAVCKAGFAELKLMQDGYDVRTKSDLTPVTSADIAANEILLEALQKYYPEIPVVSEECAPSVAESVPEKFFLVDPLDGTSDFIAGRKEFTVNVALVECGRVKLGIVFAPALGELFYGFGHDALKACPDDLSLKNAKPLRLTKRFSPKEKNFPPKILVSVSHPEPSTEKFLEGLDGERLAVGSSLKFLRIADGTANYYPRAVPLHEWDIAAGHGVLKAAGGNVYRLGTECEVEYGRRDFRTPPFEAY